MRLILLLGVCPVLSGCALSLPLQGQSGDGSETFSGVATGQIDGGGSLTLTSNKGRSCIGQFVYTSDREGSGTLTCDDGSSGPFSFVSTGSRGTGTGTLGGQVFTFSFG